MIGHVDTLQPGEQATVTTNIDEENDILYFNFGIPKGEKGDTGDTNLVSFDIQNGKLIAYDENGQIYYLGTVAMDPKGEWNNETSYEKLNTVLYNDSTYIALKPSVNVVPTNTEYWQLIGGGVTEEYLESQIVDNLDSTSSTKILSANQGKVLNENMQNLNDDLSSQNYGIFGITRSINNADHYLVFSYDGINFIQVGKKLTKLTSDASNIIKIGEYFYYFGNNSYQYSKDLINWSDEITIIEEPLSRVWSSYPFYDKSDNKLYIYISYQFKSNSNTFTTDVGFTSYYFKIIYKTATINSDGTLNIDDETYDVLYDEDKSYIDPSVIFDNVYGYLMAVKNEKTARIEIYQMNTLTSIDSLKVKLRMVGVEAPKLLTDGNGNIVCYMQDYAMIRNSNYSSDVNIQTYCCCFISDTKHFTIENQTGLEITNCIFPFRHAGLMYCDGNTNYLLNKIGIKPQYTINSNIYSIGKGQKNMEVKDNALLINYPNVVYVFTGGHSNTRNVTVKGYFKNYPLKIRIADCNVTYQGGDLPPSVLNKSFVHNAVGDVENISMNIYPQSTNLSTCFNMPYDRTE